MKRIKTIVQQSTRISLRLVILSNLAAAVTLLVATEDPHAGQRRSSPAKLVTTVHNAPLKHANVNLALYQGGKLYAMRPQALIYGFMKRKMVPQTVRIMAALALAPGCTYPSA